METALHRALSLQRSLVEEYRSSGGHLSFLLTNEKQLTTYFLSMLADVDRARKYQHAIRACVNDFASAHSSQTSIQVLDIGVGTGLLTLFAAQASPHVHVLAIDTNKYAIDHAHNFLNRALGEEDFRKRITLTVVDKKKVKALQQLAKKGYAEASVDIFVSEILGTYAESEFMFPILETYESMLRPSDRVYAVPERVVQSLVLRRISGLPVGTAYLLDKMAKRKDRNFQLTSSQHLSILFTPFQDTEVHRDTLVALGSERETPGDNAKRQKLPSEQDPISKLFQRKRESWTSTLSRREEHMAGIRSDPTATDAFQSHGDDGTLLSFIEWEAVLWTPQGESPIVLGNSLPAYRDADDKYTALARNEAWGVAVLPPITEESTLGTMAESGTPLVAHLSLGHYSKPGIPDQSMRHTLDFDLAERLADAVHARVREAKNQEASGLDSIMVFEDCTAGLVAIELRKRMNDMRIVCAFNSATDMYLATELAINNFNQEHADAIIDRPIVFQRTHYGNYTPKTEVDASKMLCVIPLWLIKNKDKKDKSLNLPLEHFGHPPMPTQPMRLSEGMKQHTVRLLGDSENHGLDKCGSNLILRTGFGKESSLEDNAFLGVLRKCEASDPGAFTLHVHTPLAGEVDDTEALPFCNVANLDRMTQRFQADWGTNRPRAMRMLASIQARCTAEAKIRFKTTQAHATPS